MNLRVVAMAALVWTGCATLPPRAAMTSSASASAKLPVLLVHGIDDDARKLRPIERRLRAAGWTDLELLELTPNDGTGGLPALAAQVDAAAAKLVRRTGAPAVDVVAFSMGALVARYWIKRLPGHVPVRRYVSISGPHHGTWTGWLRWNEGAAQMRPNSPLVVDLARDEADWGAVEAFSFWTPLDLMIVPANSSRLAGAVERTFPVVLHPLMIFDRRVQDAILQALGEGRVTVEPIAMPPRWP